MNYYHLFGILSVVVFTVAIYRSCVHRTMDFIIYAVVGCVLSIISAACLGILPGATQMMESYNPAKAAVGMGSSYVSFIGAIIGSILAPICYIGALFAKTD